MTAPVPESRDLTVYIGAGEVAAAVLRSQDGSVGVRLRIRSDLGDSAGLVLTRAQLAATREMLGQSARVAFEFENEGEANKPAQGAVLQDAVTRSYGAP